MKKTLIVAVFLLAIGLLFMVPAVRNGVIEYYRFARAPEVLKQALFVVGEEGSATLVKPSFFGLRTVSPDGYSVMEAVQMNGRVFTLLEDITSHDIDVFEIKNERPIALTRDGMYKEGLSVSPNGASLTYATVSDPLEGTNFFKYDVRRHTVYLIDLNTGEHITLGQGAHPTFVSDDTLLYTVVDGYKTQSIISDDISTLNDASANTMLFRPSIATSGFLSFKNALVPSQFFVLHADSLFPLSIKLIGTVGDAESPVTDVALREEYGYLIKRGVSTMLYEFPLSGALGEEVLLYDFKEDLPVMYIVL